MAEDDKAPKSCVPQKADRIWQILVEMDKNNENQRSFSGSLDCPAFFKATYGGRIFVGFKKLVSVSRQMEKR